MLLQVTEALAAMAAEAMVVVRATVEITVAAAVEAKEVTTLAVARAVLSVVGEAGMGACVPTPSAPADRQDPLPMFRRPGNAAMPRWVFPDHLITL